MAERRGSVRAVARIEVHNKDHRSDRVPLYVAGNVSAGGIFLITQDPFPVDTALKVRFVLPGEDHPIEAIGSVVWRHLERHGAGHQPGMGVQFTEIRTQDRERIRAFVENLVKATKGKAEDPEEE